MDHDGNPGGDSKWVKSAGPRELPPRAPRRVNAELQTKTPLATGTVRDEFGQCQAPPFFIPRASSLTYCRGSKPSMLMKMLLSKLALLTALFGFLASADRAAAAGKSLDIYWIDSEGGGSTLIVTPAGESILIDSGNPGGRDSARMHKVATETAGLQKIDFLVNTHFHIDHFGGAAELAALMPVGTVVDKGIPEVNPDNQPKDTRWPLIIKPYRELKSEGRLTIKAGDTLPLKQGDFPKLEMRCLVANQKFVAPPAGAAKNPLDLEETEAAELQHERRAVRVVGQVERVLGHVEVERVFRRAGLGHDHLLIRHEAAHFELGEVALLEWQRVAGLDREAALGLQFAIRLDD